MAMMHPGKLAEAIAAVRGNAITPKHGAVYHIAYDLITPGQDYQKVIAEIEKTPHMRILKSSWLVETDEEPVALRDRIMAVADANDQCFISQVASSCAGSLRSVAPDWLRERLGRTGGRYYG